jgi:hypothetical protein
MDQGVKTTKNVMTRLRSGQIVLATLATSGQHGARAGTKSRKILVVHLTYPVGFTEGVGVACLLQHFCADLGALSEDRSEVGVFLSRLSGRKERYILKLIVYVCTSMISLWSAFFCSLSLHALYSSSFVMNMLIVSAWPFTTDIGFDVVEEGKEPSFDALSVPSSCIRRDTRDRLEFLLTSWCLSAHADVGTPYLDAKPPGGEENDVTVGSAHTTNASRKRPSIFLGVSVSPETNTQLSFIMKTLDVKLDSSKQLQVQLAGAARCWPRWACKGSGEGTCE